MAITDIQISEELETNAPSIKYRGNEGPKSPQEMEMMAAQTTDFSQLSFELFGKDFDELNDEEFEKFKIELKLRNMTGGPVLPEDTTKPVNPFQPKPQGPVLPDRQMAAYGGIMGLDGRKRYGIGSWFQENIMDPIKKNPEIAAAAALYGLDTFGIPTGGGNKIGGGEKINKTIGSIYNNPTVQDILYGKEIKKEPSSTDIGTTRSGGLVDSLVKNLIPIAGGAAAGLFTANQPEQPGLPDDNTAIQLADLKKTANILDQQQGMAAGLNFLPAVSARKFTPAEMIETYAQSAANGGRIGFKDAGPVLDEQTTTMILDMGNRGMDVETISTITQTDANTVNAILSSQNKKAEGGIMDLGGMEKDYRAEGGFVPIGKEEKADDVPARLSVNEFVFTADAVRNAGGGDIDQGARVMENMMKHLEAGGQVSEESQGMAGARDMFAVSERLSEVV
jgi:hypothetical protein